MKSIVSATSFFLLFLLPSFGFSQAKGGLPADVFFKKGKELHKDGDIQMAIEFYDLAIQTDSYHKDALFDRAVAYASLRLPKHQKAWNDFNTVLNIDATDKDALLWRAKLSFNLKKHGQAVQDYTSLIMSDQSDYRLFINRGLAYAELVQYTYALEDFNAALGLNSQLQIAWAGKAQCAFEMKDYEEATSSYLRALELAPNEKEYEYELAEALIKNDQYADAKSILEKLMLTDENTSVESMTSLALCYLNLDEMANAKILVEAAQAKDMRNAEVYRVLGMISFFEKKYAPATAYFLEAIAWSDGPTDAYKNVAQVYLIQGEYGPAKAYADEAIKFDGLSGGSFYLRALAQKGLSYKTEACDDFFKAQSLGFEGDFEPFDFCK